MKKESKNGDEYKMIHQGTATNKLTKTRIDEKDKENVTIKNNLMSKEKELTQRREGFAIRIKRTLNTLFVISTSAYQLLDALTIKSMENGNNPNIIMSLDEFMEQRGLTDRKGTRKKVKEDLDLLRCISIEWEEKQNGNTKSYGFINLADMGAVKNGKIFFNFAPTFYSILQAYPVMPYPMKLLSLNNHNNPYSYSLLRKIAEHKNMNAGKSNEDIIAVKTLLIVANSHTYEQISNDDRAITRRIIDPFERDLDALSDTLTWNYCHAGNTPLTDEELENFNYDIFENLMIHVEWKNYPDQTERLQKKSEKAESKERQAKAKKSTSKSKKVTGKVTESDAK